MKIQLVILLIVATVLQASCVSQPPALGTPSVAEKEAGHAIALISQSCADAWNRGDLDGFLQPYDDSGRLVFVSTSVIRSAAELEQKYKKRYGAGGADFGKLSFSELQVEELVPGLARAWGKWTVQEKSKKSSGWFTLILQKEENRWRIIHDHSS